MASRIEFSDDDMDEDDVRVNADMLGRSTPSSDSASVASALPKVRFADEGKDEGKDESKARAVLNTSISIAITPPPPATSDYSAHGKYSSSSSSSSSINNIRLSGSGLSGDWIYSTSDIAMSDKVIGRGAFGEVRAAIWKNIEVACKKLHNTGLMTASPGDEGKDDDPLESSLHNYKLKTEIEMLSKLRHPNLVQFLGACLDANDCPYLIITEIMQYSLYDILEVKKVKLSLPDVIDVSVDVSAGINYLHSYDPPIVHRDISSKNILMDGKRAKISDLGQAKIFDSSVLSRQSGMPGAMAYAAPEVLTGKYSEKIDIFSFGVLIIQMCTGSYPRIDRREEHVRLASCGEFAPMAPLFNSMISYQPSDRPRADTVCQIVKDIRFSDRFYPLQKRQIPQSEISILGYQWMNEEHEKKTEEIRLLLNQTSERLKKEENRWLREADRADNADKKISFSNAEIADLQGIISMKSDEITSLREKFSTLTTTSSIATNTNKVKDAEIDKLNSIIRDFEGKCTGQAEEINYLRGESETLAHRIHGLQVELEYKNVQHNEAVEKEAESHQVLEIVNEDNQELEARLEQALTRWTKERDNLLDEKKKFASLQHKYTDLIEDMKKLKYDHKVLQDCFNEYIDLPPASTLKTMLKESKLKQLSDSDKIQQLLASLAFKDESLHTCQANYDKALLNMKTIESQKEAIKFDFDTKSVEIVKLENTIKEQQNTSVRLEGTNNLLEKERSNLSDEVASLKQKYETFSSNLSKVLNQWKVRESLDAIKSEPVQLLSIPTERVLEYILKHKIIFGRGSSNNSSSSNLFAAAEEGEEGKKGKEDEEGKEEKGQKEGVEVKNAGGKGSGNDEDFENAGFEAKKEVSFGNLVKSANKTVKMKAQMEAVSRSAADEHAEMERLRKQDSDAKALVEQALSEGANSLMTLISNRLDNAVIVWRSVRSLRDVIVTSEAVKYDCIGLHIDEVLLKAMELHERSVMLQSQCARLLGNLAFGQDFVRKRIGTNNGISLLVSALDEFGEAEEHLAINACTAITNLIHNNVENRQRFVEVGGVECLTLLMMVSYIASVKFQRQGCYLLLTLAGSDESCREIATRGGIQVVINTMTQYRFDRDVQLYGAWCICNLALAGEDIKRKLKKLGSVEVCKVALEVHKEDEEVVKYAKNALGTLGPIVTNRTDFSHKPSGEKDKKK